MRMSMPKTKNTGNKSCVSWLTESSNVGPAAHEFFQVFGFAILDGEPQRILSCHHFSVAQKARCASFPWRSGYRLGLFSLSTARHTPLSYITGLHSLIHYASSIFRMFLEIFSK